MLSVLFYERINSDLRQPSRILTFTYNALNNQATVMKLRSDVHKTVNFDVINVLLI